MALSDLFAANKTHTLTRFGVGVTASSVTYVAPNGDQTALTEFVFENSTAREFVVSPATDDGSEIGEIDVSIDLVIHEKGHFMIDGQKWTFRGRGGRDLSSQTILLSHPRETNRKQTKGPVR
jgi:hypothetical protein